MPLPKIIPGGTSTLWNADDPNFSTTRGTSGQFANYPGSTPKYAINSGYRDAEYRETLARMFIQMPAQERKLFVNSTPPETRELAKVLCGIDSGASGGTGFIDFLLTSVNESLQEKLQIVESLSDNFVVYVFGQKAPVFQYSGTLYNTYQDDQRVWMTRIYRDIARGTQLARRRKLIRLRYDSVIVSGILINLQQVISGDAVNYAQFSFSMIPMQYVIFTQAFGTPTRLKTGFTEGSQYGLVNAIPPATERLRTTTPTYASRPSAKPAAQPANTHTVTALKKNVPKMTTQSNLKARTIDTTAATSEADKKYANLYGGGASIGQGPQSIIPTT